MRENALLSVIVPVYNNERFLDKCITSICEQTYSNLDIILIDDGSTDQSGIICDSYLAKDDRIRVFHIENRGAAGARNVGISNAYGNYIAFVDSDDWIEPNYAQICIDYLIKDNSDIVCCALVDYKNDCLVNIQTTITKHHVIIERKDYYHVLAMIFSAIGDDGSSCLNISGGACKLYRKEALEGKKFPIGMHIGEDTAFLVDVMDNTDRITIIDNPLYNRIINPCSATRRKSNQYGRERMKYLRWINAKLVNSCVSETDYRSLMNYLEQSCYLAVVRKYSGYFLNYKLFDLKKKMRRFSSNLPFEIEWSETREDKVVAFFARNEFFWLYRVYNGFRALKKAIRDNLFHL